MYAVVADRFPFHDGADTLSQRQRWPNGKIPPVRGRILPVSTDTAAATRMSYSGVVRIVVLTLPYPPFRLTAAAAAPTIWNIWNVWIGRPIRRSGDCPRTGHGSDRLRIPLDGRRREPSKYFTIFPYARICNTHLGRVYRIFTRRFVTRVKRRRLPAQLIVECI